VFYFSFRILFGTLRAVLCILIVIFGFIPVLFRYTYPLQRTVIFLNFGKCNVHCHFKLWGSFLTNPIKQSPGSISAVQKICCFYGT
jgi:hypothetical protein